MLLSRFHPQTAAIANVKSGTTTDCAAEFLRLLDLYPNSNSAAWPINNAYGLWEIIDADTSESDDSVSGNLGELAYHLGIVQGTYSLSGNIPNTLKSSKCLHGSPANSHPFNGSYRDD